MIESLLDRIKAITIDGDRLGDLEPVIVEVTEFKEILKSLEEEIKRRLEVEFDGNENLVKIIGEQVAVTRVFRRVRELVGDPEQMDKRFLEWKLNTEAVTEYFNENGRLPDGVAEKSSSYIKISNARGKNAKD